MKKVKHEGLSVIELTYRGMPIIEDDFPDERIVGFSSKGMKDMYAQAIYGTNHKWYYDWIYLWHRIKDWFR